MGVRIQNVTREQFTASRIGPYSIWSGNNKTWSTQVSYKLSYIKKFYFGEGNGSPLHYSCLENPMDRRTWWATVHGVTNSQIQLNQLSTHVFTLSAPFLSQIDSKIFINLRATAHPQIDLPNQLNVSSGQFPLTRPQRCSGPD